MLATAGAFAPAHLFFAAAAGDCVGGPASGIDSAFAFSAAIRAFVSACFCSSA